MACEAGYIKGRKLTNKAKKKRKFFGGHYVTREEREEKLREGNCQGDKILARREKASEGDKTEGGKNYERKNTGDKNENEGGNLI